MVCACLFLVNFLSFAWVLSHFDSGFSLAFLFPNSHGVLGLFLGVALDCRKVLDLGDVVLEKSQGLGVEMIFFGKPSIGGWRQENSSRDSEGILRHPNLVWFYGLRISLGEIMLQ